MAPIRSDWILDSIRQFKYYIYQIECTKNGKKYIGCTQNLPQGRIQKHFGCLRSNRHTNKDLQRDFNLYGEEYFKVTWLCATNDKDAERQWMIKLKTYDSKYGYNSGENYFGSGRWLPKVARLAGDVYD